VDRFSADYTVRCRVSQLKGVGVSEDSLRISDLENEIGVPVGFFGRLLKEDSWSFVIKLHAFFEGLLSNLLAQSLHREELRDVFSYTRVHCD
jgi:hypothetical protein